MADDELEELNEPVDGPAEDAAETGPGFALPDGDDASPEASPPVEYGASDNLATVLPFTFLQNLGQEVLMSAEQDYRTTKSWRETTAKHTQLYNGDIPDNIPDQENLTAMHLPFGRRAVKMFKAKMFPQLYPPNGEIVVLKVQSPALEEAAARCTAHMNQQLVNEIVEYIPSHDRGMTQDLIEGEIFEVWWYDPVKARPCQEICLAEDVWFNYQAKIDDPSMPDVRITWRKRYQQHQLEAMEDAGYYVCITKPNSVKGGAFPALFPDGQSYTETGVPRQSADETVVDDRPVKEASDRSMGQEEQKDDPTGPRQVLEQDRMLKLPGEKRQRAVTVCVDRSTGRVLRLSLREKEDRKDRQRYQREAEMLAAQHESALAMHADAMGQYQGQMQEIEALIAQGAAPEGLQLPAPPMEPQAPPPPAPPKRVPWDRWTKYDCEVNPSGALGQGVLHDVAGHNILANKVSTRAVSLLTLCMLPTGIGSRQTKFMRGETQLKLGAINQSEMSPEQLARTDGGFKWLTFPPPPNNWEKAVELADKSAQEVTAFDIAAGGPGKSGETATEAEMRHSNATDNISLVSQRYNRARAMSVRNLAFINSLTLPPEGVRIYMEVPQPSGEAAQLFPPGQAPPKQEVYVTREDYEMILDELEVTFTCDPSLESQPIQERRAMKAFQTGMQVVTTTAGPGGPPILDPQTSVMMLRALAVNVMKAAKMPRELIRMLEQAPLPNAQPMMMGGGPNGEGQEGGPPGGDGAPGPGGPMDQGEGGGPSPDAGGPPPT